MATLCIRDNSHVALDGLQRTPLALQAAFWVALLETSSSADLE